MSGIGEVTENHKPIDARGKDGQYRSIRVVIEGTDLTGKSTLAASLVSRLQEGGVPAVHQKGFLYQNLLLRLLSRWGANSHPRSAWLNSMYIASAILDSAMDLFLPRRKFVTVCESYVDRAIVYGIATRLGWVGSLAAKAGWLFPRFDLCVLLCCCYGERLNRLNQRSEINAVDLQTTRTQEVHDSIDFEYRKVVERHYASVVINTDEASREEVLKITYGLVVGALRGRREHGNTAGARDVGDH